MSVNSIFKISIREDAWSYDQERGTFYKVNGIMLEDAVFYLCVGKSRQDESSYNRSGIHYYFHQLHIRYKGK